MNTTTTIVAVTEFEHSTQYVLWDGEKLSTVSCKGLYNNDLVKFNQEIGSLTFATIENKKIAVEWYANNQKDYSYLAAVGCNTYIGCVVTIAKSRKVENNKQYKVVGFNEGGFNGMCKTKPQIAVKYIDEIVWISTSCIKEVNKGAYPYWYSEN